MKTTIKIFLIAIFCFSLQSCNSDDDGDEQRESNTCDCVVLTETYQISTNILIFSSEETVSDSCDKDGDIFTTPLDNGMEEIVTWSCQ